VGAKIFKRIKTKKTDLIACWPGIGNIGITAVDTLRGQVQAEEFGEIEPWDFFYPQKVSIKKGFLEELKFPRSRFYFKKVGRKGLIFFIGEEQAMEGEDVYAKGKKAYEMANLVLDVAEQFGCQRVYTSGAAVAPVHHTMRPKVWAVSNKKELLDEIERYKNTILMSKIEGVDNQGSITGLNGLLLGVAKKRGLEGICLMGEIPFYLQAFPLPYPKASKSVLEVLSRILGIGLDLSQFDNYVTQVEETIEKWYRQLPSEIKDRLEELKHIRYVKPTRLEPITEMSEEDKKKLIKDIERFLQKGGE